MKEEILTYLANPECAKAQLLRYAHEAEGRLEEIAERRVAIQQRLAKLDAQTDYILRLGRETTIAPARLQAQLRTRPYRGRDAEARAVSPAVAP